MTSPSATKIFMTLVVVAPMDRSTAISRVFSSTSMTSVATTMKLATSMMKPRITAMAIRSIMRAEKRLRFISPQSLVRKG